MKGLKTPLTAVIAIGLLAGSTKRTGATIGSALLALTLVAWPASAAEEPQMKVATGGCLAGGGDCLELAVPVEPDQSVSDPQPRPWDSVSVAGDGMGLTVYFWMGPADCNGLRSVEVEGTATGIDAHLYSGTPAGAEDLVCIQFAELYQASILLEEPLIGGGVGTP